ncbi:prostaglandin E synthase 2 isoform X1 [Schistocerca cancellata]|uniref:prostaglandin E synthase 2 isoform X1 n=1 Tax=Schistocerca cancellata TaxID=274614 RepID=UPI00211805CA|nr:prostaglandin E synthase 2 isoform X1 [Schistocerca cancellata]
MATCSFWRIKNISKALRSSPYLFQEGKFNVRSNSSYSSSSGAKPGMSVTRLGLISVGLGALVGTGYSFHKMYEARVPILNKGTGAESFVLKSLPDVATSRSVVSPTDNTGLKLKLFQYPTCPFCCKVRAFLDYHGFSYDVVEVDPVLRQEIKWSHYKKVPILLAQVEDGYQQLNDSSMIISALMSYLYERDQTLQDVVKFYPSIEYKDDNGTVKKEIMNRYFLMFHGNIPKDRTKEDILLERKWRKWVDDVLVHTLSPNVYRTREEAFQAFNWFSEVGEWDKLFPAWERFIMVYVGAVAMWIIGKRLKRRHNLKDDVRQSLYDECNFWIKTIKKQGTPFLGGSRPNLADLAVYGALTSIEGCNAFADLLANTKIGPWYSAMKESVQNHAGSVAMSS